MGNAPSTDMTAMRDAVANGSVTAESICATMMAGARTHNPQLNAYHEVFEEQAMEAARKVDADARAGRPLPPLAGMPIAVKDNLATVLGRTTCSSRMLENYRSPFDAAAVERLLHAGAIVTIVRCPRHGAPMSRAMNALTPACVSRSNSAALSARSLARPSLHSCETIATARALELSPLMTSALLAPTTASRNSSGVMPRSKRSSSDRMHSSVVGARSCVLPA